MTWRLSAGDYMGTAVYHLQGDLDSTVGALQAELTSSANDGSVLLDLTGVDSVDSSGLTELLGVIRSIHDQGGRIAIASVRPGVTQDLRTAGFDRLVYLAESPLEGMGWLSIGSEVGSPPVEDRLEAGHPVTG
ncbi:MAG TPA: STAS domain-containing protein [Acidimicrobiales bacterium]|nr:STAS domain-containing protein [Acidimicrobiales bacterium]